jgi:glucose-1-phosphate cytidylyltransferase
MTVTQPRSRFGVVETGNSGIVTSFREKPVNRDLVNIGFFVFEPEIFQLLNEESVLEESPLKHLAQNGELGSFKHDGFWQPMDTFREFQDFNSMWESGESPWKIWGK